MQISVSISVSCGPYKRWELCNESKNGQNKDWSCYKLPAKKKKKKKRGVTTKEIHGYIVQILAEDSPSYATEEKRAVEFLRGKDSTENDRQSGRPKTSPTEEQVDDILRMVLYDRRLTVQQITKSIIIISGSAHTEAVKLALNCYSILLTHQT